MNEITGGTPYDSMLFPSCAALYTPFNESFIDETYEIWPHYPYATGHYLFVTDTGNHRVVMLNRSYSGQLDYITQFGVTGQERSDDTGLNWPWGIAVYAPAWESNYSSTFANIF